MGVRPERVAKELKRYISEVIQKELKDPRIGFITVTDVDITKDLKSARIYYSILGTRTEKNNTVSALKSATGYIKKLIGANLGLRYIPELVFIEDESAKRAQRVMKILDKSSIQGFIYLIKNLINCFIQMINHFRHIADQILLSKFWFFKQISQTSIINIILIKSDNHCFIS